MRDWLTTTVGIGLPLLTFLTVRAELRNKRLKDRLRLALLDNIAFWYCENAACDVLAGFASWDRKGETVSGLAMKRIVRTKLRAQGFATPSDRAQPNKLEGELRAL